MRTASSRFDPSSLQSNLHLVNPQLGFGRATLVEPTRFGYVYVAASVRPGLFPFVLPSRRRARLIRQLAPMTEKLAALEGVRRVTVFRAVVMPPTARFSAYLKERSLHVANFDLAILIETTSTTGAHVLQSRDTYRELLNTIRVHARYTWTMIAHNVKRIADVETSRGGLFLFNHFAADSEATMFELWDYLAAWYVRKTGLRNSVALAPMDQAHSDYAIVNWARWDVHPLRHFWHQLADRTFWQYVVANLDANRAASMPIYLRRV